MSNIFFTSDTHFGHANIASKNGSKWKSGQRQYKSLDDHNAALIRAINETVGPDDTLYHLGDWSFGGKDNIWNFRKQLYCHNVHLILGNHDHYIEENIILPNCHYNWMGDYVDGKPDPNFENQWVYARDLFSSVGHYKEVNINGRIFVLSHYGMRVWHGSHKGWIHLYGHSHGTLPAMGKSKDTGVDVAIREKGKPVPFSFTEIVDFMDKQNIIYNDHHEESTNTGKRPQ